jgi:hypothetical protein
MQFKGRLEELAREPDNKFFLIDTQGTLTDEEWANELHPGSRGFKKIAQKFVNELRANFPVRI